jgi:hypothetical protein
MGAKHPQPGRRPQVGFGMWGFFPFFRTIRFFTAEAQ